MLGQNNHEIYEKDLKIRAVKITDLKTKGVL